MYHKPSIVSLQNCILHSVLGCITGGITLWLALIPTTSAWGITAFFFLLVLFFAFLRSAQSDWIDYKHFKKVEENHRCRW